MTRFEKWIAQQDRVDLICNSTENENESCEGCVLLPVCDKYKYATEKVFMAEAEAYLDEEVGDEESPKRTD